MRSVEKVNELWDFAVSHPDGFTWADAAERFAWAKDRPGFFAVVRRLRLTLGGDTINLVCTPQAPGELWLYTLTGTYEAARPWNANRLNDLEKRLETIAHVSKSLVAATDGRTVDGRKARLISKTVGRLVEDLEEMLNGPRLF